MDSNIYINFIYTAGYLIGGVVAFLFGKNLITVLAKRVDDGDDSNTSSYEQRAKTISSLVRNVLSISISGVVLTMILAQWGVNIAPILAGAGVLGLAVGFGAQTLVKDIVTGFFILFENLYNVGDVVEVAGLKGEVTALQLRTTILKGEDGMMHIIPNSKIDKITKIS